MSHSYSLGLTSVRIIPIDPHAPKPEASAPIITLCQKPFGGAWRAGAQLLSESFLAFSEYPFRFSHVDKNRSPFTFSWIVCRFWS